MEKVVLIYKDASKKTRALTEQANSKQFSEEYLIEDMRGCLNTIKLTNMMISDDVAKHSIGSEVWGVPSLRSWYLPGTAVVGNVGGRHKAERRYTRRNGSGKAAASLSAEWQWQGGGITQRRVAVARWQHHSAQSGSGIRRSTAAAASGGAWRWHQHGGSSVWRQQLAEQHGGSSNWRSNTAAAATDGAQRRQQLMEHSSGSNCRSTAAVATGGAQRRQQLAEHSGQQLAEHSSGSNWRSTAAAATGGAQRRQQLAEHSGVASHIKNLRAALQAPNPLQALPNPLSSSTAAAATGGAQRRQQLAEHSGGSNWRSTAAAATGGAQRQQHSARHGGGSSVWRSNTAAAATDGAQSW
ncbi:hypothetical protein PSHT_04288 [Puccinia striiformis]|uniref:Uncharacterized protein n=1 Tax=Puccinia striiformis TaxID=27350 RepID=A0A2S4WDI8_9BASI|nr:hypothetical protein PSHT_04288 [Puccinia striiformis]